MLTIHRSHSSDKHGGCCYKYSSTQVNLPADLSARVARWGERNVLDLDLFEEEEEPPSRHSREYESHITILYGIHEADPQRVLSLFRGVKPFTIELGRVSLFKLSPKFDVIKIEVLSPRLQELNELVRQRVTTTQVYPDYRPHVTIAFAKKGLYDHLEGHTAFAGLTFDAKQIQFSNPYGERSVIYLEPGPGDRRRWAM